MILLDRWELMDRRLNGRYQHVGDADSDAYLTTPDGVRKVIAPWLLPQLLTLAGAG